MTRAVGGGLLYGQVRLEGFSDLVRVDAKVRRGPDDAAILDEDGLWRLMPYAQPRGDGVRQLAVGLNRHHGVSRTERLMVQVLDELIERFGADPARVAVLEQQERSHRRPFQERVELFHMMQRRQLRVH